MSVAIPDPLDPTVWIIPDATIKQVNDSDRTTTLLHVHPQRLCKGRACVLHAPSDHHMRDWTLHWDKRMYRLCPRHRMPHPDPDDMNYRKLLGEYSPLHVCCGCCRVDAD